MSKTRVTDSELAAIIRAEIASADGLSELSAERALNMDYYQCRPFGNELEGRSSVVSSDVRGQVNNSARANMADIRAAFNDLIWFEYGVGDGSVTPAYASGTSFTLNGADATAVWHAGRRVKAVGTSTGTIYGTISSSAYASSTTTVNVTWDSGALANESLTLYLSQIPVLGNPAPGRNIVQAVLDTIFSDTTTVSGTWFDLPGLSVTITPRSAANKVRVQLVVNAAPDATCIVYLRIARSINGGSFSVIGAGSATGSQIAAAVGVPQNVGGGDQPAICSTADYLDDPTTSASVEYKVQAVKVFGSPGGLRVNASADGSVGTNDVVTISSITAEELF